MIHFAEMSSHTRVADDSVSNGGFTHSRGAASQCYMFFDLTLRLLEEDFVNDFLDEFIPSIYQGSSW